MSASARLQQAPWWQHAPAQTPWQSVQDASGLARSIACLLAHDAPEPDLLLIPRAAVSELEACFGAVPAAARTRLERDQRLHALWLRHGPDTVLPAQRIGVPARLWDRLLDHLGARKLPGRRCWQKTAESDEILHQGVTTGACMEWWGLPALPGATYDDRLWAWGAVQPLPAARSHELGELSPRQVWRSDGSRWHVHPDLARALATTDTPGLLPRLADGPGYLLACIVDAMAELLGGCSYTSRDLSVIWATMLLPVLAPSVEIDRMPALGALDAGLHAAPDYLQTLAFYMLHPRAQTAIVVLDRLSTLLVAEDHDTLAQVLCQLAPPAAWAPAAADIPSAVYRLIGQVAEQALHRRASARWDGGFGFKLFRKLLRDVLVTAAPVPAPPDEAPAFARRWDAAVHGPAGDASSPDEGPGCGALAQRLREALSTALWFPGRPLYAGGPVAQQILDLAWMRWIDDDFLA